MTTDATLPGWVTAGLEAVEADQEARQVIPGRFPFTYAYDFLRSHPAAFGAPEGMSRGGAADWLWARIADADQRADHPRRTHLAGAPNPHPEPRRLDTMITDKEH